MESSIKKGVIENEKEVVDPDTIPVLFHEKKQEILKLLIQKEMTIIDLKKTTKMNPGTIKRHLNDLIDKSLVFQSRIEINKYGIKMKFYRATAKKYSIHISWP